jgi:hypothetical protein
VMVVVMVVKAMDLMEQPQWLPMQNPIWEGPLAPP